MKANRGSLGRAASLAQLGAGLVGSYLGYQLQRPFLNEQESGEKRRKMGQRNARRVREQLQDLRGPVMKLGQALSMQTHLLDENVVRELAALQMQAPPMHATLMKAQFRSAFGRSPLEVFQSFDHEPFAAASLGQVHHAVTRAGEAVVVKIQYPAIREAVASDFKMLRTAGLAARFSGHLTESVIGEVERGVMEETDYLHEARNLEYFRKHLAPLKFVQVPKVHPELSCDRVLTMSFVRGQRLGDFLESHPSQETRDKIGAALTHLFFFQLFRARALHADPHPGNYLFNEDGTIGLVDFGCVKHLKPEVIRCYAQFWSREWTHDEALYAEIIRVIFGPKVSPQAPHTRRCMSEIKRFYDQFHPLVEPTPAVDLADGKFMTALGELAKVLLKNKFLSPEFVFLSRTEMGMCNLLHSLKARVRTSAIAREWMPSDKAARGGARALPRETEGGKK